MLFSHAAYNLVSQKTEPTKLLKQHIGAVERHVRKNFYKKIFFSYPIEMIEAAALAAARFHDAGKATSFFQTYLLTGTGDDLKNHARISANYAFSHLLKLLPQEYNKREVLAYFVYTVILRHHGNIKNFLDDALFSEAGIKTRNILNIQHGDLLKRKETLKSELNINPDELGFFNEDTAMRIIRKINREPAYENYFLLLYLYSLLLEADKIDASQAQPAVFVPIPALAVTDYTSAQLHGVSDMNIIRNSIRSEVLTTLNAADISQTRLFTLTAPTGTGKTLTALSAALTLRERIFREESCLPQIIYSLPFINILEQTVKTIQDVFGNNGTVLAHYQFSNLKYDEVSGSDYAARDETTVSYNQAKELLETWQADLIVTTFVQLFHTIIGNSNRLLKKFHRLSGAIIILDEIQAVDTKFLPLFGAALFALAKHLDAKIILMTATHPKIFEAAELLLPEEHITKSVLELLPNHRDFFRHFNRTKIIPKAAQVIDDDSFLEIFAEEWNPGVSCLIVVNMIKRSITLFNKLAIFLENGGHDNPIYYLSTNLTPADRLKRLAEIRAQLARGAKPILVSTQTVEAGVDLSFDIGFRDIGPIDSIIQVAGRINRHAAGTTAAPLYIVNFGECSKIYGAVTYQTARTVLMQDKPGSKETAPPAEIEETGYLELINQYYSIIIQKKSLDESTEIFAAMKELRFTKLAGKIEKSIDDFRLIADLPFMESVFIEQDEDDQELLLKYTLFSKGNIPVEEFAKYKEPFQRRIVQINKKLLSPLSDFRINEFLYRVPLELCHQFYSEKTGFIREHEQEEMNIML